MKLSEALKVPPNSKVRLKNFAPDWSCDFRDKDQAEDKLKEDITRLNELQGQLFAEHKQSLLIILQGIDASGKDGTVSHVMTGMNPSGCQVTSFKVPSEVEANHDYLWRYHKALPERGKIGIFNRSYYEEVLVVRVHPELSQTETPLKESALKELWKKRYAEINNYEQYLVENGTHILKFFLHLSKDEQRRRFLERLNQKEKNWKYAESDIAEREYWADYETAFEAMLSHTSTKAAPWYLVPADHKWFAHVAVADIIARQLTSLDLDYPRLKGERKKEIRRAIKRLTNEKET
jgi:PPK2 family polyphosphate:nucleotide phosphotransferase